MKLHSRTARAAFVVAAAHVAPIAAASAQRIASAPSWLEATAGAELETYLRAAQLAGDAPLHPWTLRALSPAELARVAPARTHPWARRYGSQPRDSALGRLQLVLLAPEARAWYNSAFPSLSVSGPVWAGRGLTSSLSAGVFVRYGPLSLALRPVVFRAENASFALAPVGRGSARRFEDALFGTSIDLPQRFGDGAYARLDLGESTLRLEIGPATVGLSSASETWGPSDREALVLGANAPGFVHAFVGTSRPLNVLVGRVHARVVAGRLEQSAWAPPGSDARAGTGVVATFMPRGVPGLELGATRFFHRWTRGQRVGPGDLLVRSRGSSSRRATSRSRTTPTLPATRPTTSWRACSRGGRSRRAGWSSTARSRRTTTT
jgi:hypothetical protein